MKIDALFKVTPTSDYLIKAYEELRSDVNLANPQDYILALFILQFITNDLRYNYKNQKRPFPFPIIECSPGEADVIDYDFISFNMYQSDIAEYINSALESIENFYDASLKEVFINIDFNVIKDILANIIRIIPPYLTNYNFGINKNRLQEVEDFEILLSYIISKQYHEISTPSFLSKLLAELLEIKEGESVYDPTCGVGSLLVGVAKTVNHNTCQFYGQEISQRFHRLSKINLFVHKIKNVTLECGDTIRNPKFLTEDGHLKTFDKIIAIPPFSVLNWGIEIAVHDIFKRFEYGLPPRNFSDYAFISHMIKSLKPYGTMCIAIPSGALFRERTETNIRQRLIEENLIDTVITLPIVKIYSSNISLSIIIIKKNRINKDILFIDASSWYKLSSIRERIIADEHIKDVISIYKNREEIKDISYNASFEEIKLNNFNLHIKKYVDIYKQNQSKIEIDSIENNLLAIKLELETIEHKMKAFETNFIDTIEKKSNELLY